MVTLVYTTRAATRGHPHDIMTIHGFEPLYLSDLTEAERADMDDGELRQIALGYERDHHHKDFRSMARRGTLEAHLARKVELTRNFAQQLIGQNEDPEAAWNRAIRVVLLERAED